MTEVLNDSTPCHIILIDTRQHMCMPGGKIFICHDHFYFIFTGNMCDVLWYCVKIVLIFLLFCMNTIFETFASTVAYYVWY